MHTERGLWKILVGGLVIAGVALQVPRAWAEPFEVDPKVVEEARQAIDQMPDSAEKAEMQQQFDSFEKDVSDGKVDDAGFTKDLEAAVVEVEHAGEGTGEGGTVGATAEGVAGTETGAGTEVAASAPEIEAAAEPEIEAAAAPEPEVEKPTTDAAAENVTDSTASQQSETTDTFLRNDTVTNSDGTTELHGVYQHADGSEHDHGTAGVL